MPTPPNTLSTGVQRRFVSSAAAHVTLQKRADGVDGQQIVGYGAVFYDGTPATEYRLWDDMVERIMPTAFDRAVKEDDVRGLVNHDPNQLMGRTVAKTMRLSIDAKGLKYEIDPPDRQDARDAQVSIGRGDMTGSSFAFIPDLVKWTEERQADDRIMYVREIHDTHLFDVGPVTYPAYDGTTAGLRAAIGGQQIADLRAELEAWKAGRTAPVVGPTRDQVMTRARLVELDQA